MNRSLQFSSVDLSICARFQRRGKMKCRGFEKLLALYIEGDLGSRKARKVEAHLSECTCCRGFADELKQSQAELKAFAQVPIDSRHREAVREAVVTEILARPELIQRRRLWLPPEIRWQRVTVVMAVILLAMATALFLSNREPQEVLR
jgi:predicted anti-sigma-YlaC factor YlaD